MDYRDTPPQHRGPHNVKWTSFAPPGWTNFAPPLTRPLFLEEGQHLTPPQLSADDHSTLGVNAVDLEYVLRKINANRDN